LRGIIVPDKAEDALRPSVALGHDARQGRQRSMAQ